MGLTVANLNHRGEGVAPDHPPIPRVLPGEVVSEDGRIFTPSADRVAAPCRHYKSCGGCAMQHASDPFVATWKRDVIAQGLMRRGIATEIRETITSPPQSRRRAVLHGRRTKKAALVGFHMRGSHNLIAVPDCLLLHPDLMAALPMLEEITRSFASRKGELRFHLTRTEGGLDLDIGAETDPDQAQITDLAATARAHDLARLTWNGETVALRRPPILRFGRAQITPPPGSFLQATEQGEAALLDGVREAVGGAKRITELFAGCGTFSLPLAEQAELHAVEGEAEMLAALHKGWAMSTGLKLVTTETRDLFRRPFLAQEFPKMQAVVIDPPRAGAEAQSHELANDGPPRIAAVSCNPVTFARDAEILTKGGYRLDWVQPVDQFRWAAHVELVAQFTR